MDEAEDSVDIDPAALQRAWPVLQQQSHRLPPEFVGGLTREVVSSLSRRLAGDRRPPGGPSDEQLDSFCDALVATSDADAAEQVRQARERGVELDAIYLGYLAAAARRLGERWEEDRVSFWQVSLAGGRIYGIMRDLRHEFTPSLASLRRHALFAAMPGDQHTLGAAIAADMFRSRGWDIQLEMAASTDELVAAFARSDHDIIGISASRNEQLADLVKLVVALRCCKLHAFVLVGGHIVEDVADLEDLLDVDACAGTPQRAIAVLEELVDTQAR